MNEPADTARQLLDRFSTATGASGGSDRRYLWTDAFAVCTHLGVGDVGAASSLADRVHETLGRHRPDDDREGWISGLPEEEGRRHPTVGGLRIGKPLPESDAEAPPDPRVDWDRDGQYFHYLTQWIRALTRLATASGEARWGPWAAELAITAFERFSHGIGPVPNRLYWKMSIDLSRPAVPSMGQHDALDGYVAFSELRHVLGEAVPAPLDAAIDALAGMATESEWVSDDALGTGALLAYAWILARVPDLDRARRGRILEGVLDAAGESLRAVAASRLLELPATRRLAFRELGLSLGLSGVRRLVGAVREGWAPDLDRDLIARLAEALPMRAAIHEFWLDEANRRVAAWIEHEDINTVMLAASLAPDGYLGAGPAG